MSEPLTDAELDAIKAAVADQANGWDRGAVGWLTIPGAFIELAPRIIAALDSQQAEICRLRAQVADLLDDEPTVRAIDLDELLARPDEG